MAFRERFNSRWHGSARTHKAWQHPSPHDLARRGREKRFCGFFSVNKKFKKVALGNPPRWGCTFQQWKPCDLYQIFEKQQQQVYKSDCVSVIWMLCVCAVRRNASKENLSYLCNLFLNTATPCLERRPGSGREGNLLMALGNCTHSSNLLGDIQFLILWIKNVSALSSNFRPRRRIWIIFVEIFCLEI